MIFKYIQIIDSRIKNEQDHSNRTGKHITDTLQDPLRKFRPLIYSPAMILVKMFWILLKQKMVTIMVTILVTILVIILVRGHHLLVWWHNFWWFSRWVTLCDQINLNLFYEALIKILLYCITWLLRNWHTRTIASKVIFP